MIEEKINTIPQFIPGTKGQLFSLNISSVDSPKGVVVFLPSVGEELNRCRRMVADQARLFAEYGYSCWVLDYYGTGDSDGDFIDVDWGVWLQDLHEFCNRYIDESMSVTFFGVRVGALLAMDYLSKYGNSNLNRVVLFQPVLSGKRYVTQMFRQRTAFLVSNELPPESTDDMWRSVEIGESLEIGGYRYNSRILDALGNKNIQELTKDCRTKLLWMENVKAEGASLPAGSKKAIELINASESDLAVRTFCDPPIWQLHKRAEMKNNLEVLGEIIGELL